MIIAFGIAALVGILTAIDTAIYTMGASFSSLGSTSFSIRPANIEVDRIERGRKVKESKSILYAQAQEFKDRFDMPGQVCISIQANYSAQAKVGDKESNPNLLLVGTDENEPFTKGHEMAAGRFFNEKEVTSAAPVIVVGHFIVNTLFNNQDDRAIDSKISIDGRNYRIIGTLVEEGSTMNQASDRLMYIPVTLARQLYGHSESNFSIEVGVTSMDKLDDIISESIGLMRKVRRLKTLEPNDFEVVKADGIIAIIEENTQKLRWAAIGIGIITLLGAAIGLMNIMLVSVTERTREIGIIKSLGATKSDISRQFLIESILICQIGGLVGIILGLLSGVVVSKLLDGVFFVPWLWILLGIVLCSAVGLISGIYPALKAAALDPIESLRYE